MTVPGIWTDTGLVDAAGRPILLTGAPDFTAAFGLFAPDAGLCTLLVVADASGESGRMLCDLAAAAIAGGVRAVGICGGGSDRFEDCFDEVVVDWAERVGEPDDRTVMTWSVKADALDEAWSLFHNVGCVDGAYAADIKMARLLVIGAPDRLDGIDAVRRFASEEEERPK